MASLPKFMVVQVKGRGWLKHGKDNAVVIENGDGVFDPLTKVEVEWAKDGYVNLRFCQTNKYWARGADGWLVANSTKPEADSSKPTCTLFEYLGEGGFRHVQSRGRVNMNDSNNRMYVANPKVSTGLVSLTVSEWLTFGKLPPYVAFKGKNNKFLETVSVDNKNYLQFSSNDKLKEECHFETTEYAGFTSLRSLSVDLFWRHNSPHDDWILADARADAVSNADTLFSVTKNEDNTVCLYNQGASRYCTLFSDKYKINCLYAESVVITDEARLTPFEIHVKSRKVRNVKYQMEDARVYNEKPFVAGTTTAVNNTDQESLVEVEIPYEETNAYTFNRSVPATAGGVTATLKARTPLVAEEGLLLSTADEEFEWSKTKTTVNLVKATGAVLVPAKSVAKVRYVGTLGTCDIPFTYTQEDESSSDGSVTCTEKADGVFTGVNSYNFNFEVEEVSAV